MPNSHLTANGLSLVYAHPVRGTPQSDMRTGHRGTGVNLNSVPRSSDYSASRAAGSTSGGTMTASITCTTALLATMSA